MVDIRPARLGDIHFLAESIRRCDLLEARALGIQHIGSALREGLEQSDWCKVAVDDYPVCIFGVRPRSNRCNTGVPWFIGTDAMDGHRRAFMREAPGYIAMMLQAYPRLINRVHAKNTNAVAWLARVGFHMEPVHTHPLTGEPFHWFTKEA